MGSYYADLSTLACCGSIVFCSLVLIDVYYNWAKLKASPQRVMAWWAATDLIKAINMLPFGVERSPSLAHLCFARGFLETTLNFATLFWATALATNLVMIAATKTPARNLMRYEIIWDLCAIVVSPLLAAVPLIIHAGGRFNSHFYGATGSSCWITPRFRVYRMYMAHYPTWAVLLYTIITAVVAGFIITSRFKLTRSLTDSDDSQRGIMARYAVRCTIQILTFALAYLPLSIVQLRYLKDHQSPPPALLSWSILSMGGQGCLTAISYFSVRVIAYVSRHRRRNEVVHGTNNTSRKGSAVTIKKPTGV
ncbi:hypothetical protein RI367_002293 [Sorochytrium milnesiophthora]